MSRTELHIGKIKPIEKLESESFEGYTKRVFGDKFNQEVYDKYSEHEHTDELIDDCNLYEKVFLIQDRWWKTTEHQEMGDDFEINQFILNEDGSYSFVMQFYNGECCFSEMIEEAVEKLK